jgi:excisionase family DNA binding protein
MPLAKAKKAAAVTPGDVLTLLEAAAYLRVAERAVREMADAEVLPARKIGGEWRFLKSALQDWLRHRPTGRDAEELIDRLIQHSLNGRKQPEPGSKQAIMGLVGQWKDDPTVDDMLREIYRQRGRPMTEQDE